VWDSVRRFCPGGLALVVICGLSGCFASGEPSCDKRQEYQASSSIAPLHVPDDMNQPDRSSALVIPELSPDAKQRQKNDPCLESPPDYFGR